MKGFPIEEFGKYQFHRETMKEYLSEPVYKALMNAIQEEEPLSQKTADSVAHAMKTWALELGASHFCHWFQPLTGKTAEKHKSFLRADSQSRPIMSFSGKHLLKDETDGSSFPNGGLRDTFEARGYTFWDASSYAFVRKHVLYIPGIFVSYTGEKLDQKLPLLQAKTALSRQATKVLRLMGKSDVDFVSPMIGLEQEYFLVDKKKAQERPDIIFCNRVLFSCDVPKGGEFEETYFSHILPRVQAFMRDVNETCWSLGIFAELEHNEVAPGQYEFSAIYDQAIISIDQNMLVMDILREVADQHGFICLLYEKPFTGMNGSGKHNNFSLITSTGEQLFDLGDQPNLQFILFVAAFIEACDRHQTLIRMASSSEGNDHRLGGNEAPPAIISIFLGSPLHKLFKEIEKSATLNAVTLTTLIEPVIHLAEQRIEATDRNRTSPISFSGNKFEIRMLGSSMNPSGLNTFVFLAMAEVLSEFAKKIEKRLHLGQDLYSCVVGLVHESLKKHSRILFDGDGYKKTWIEEAKERGLERFDHYIDSIEILKDEKTIHLCEKFQVLNREELRARHHILLADFIHQRKIQARILQRMASQGVYPALLSYQVLLEKVAKGGFSRSALRRCEENARFLDQLDEKALALEECTNRLIREKEDEELAQAFLKELRPKMEDLIELLQKIELYTPYDVFPYPGQDALLIQ